MRLCPDQAPPQARHAALRRFHDLSDQPIDEGLLLWFPAPHSFTGEAVCEVHSHGSPVVQGKLIASLIEAGARHAEPGEFSQRAFLNGRMDLIQAEAIADLIAASTEQAARAAQRSLEGVFSEHVNALVADTTALRVWIEAALDFPDEDIDFLAEGHVEARLDGLLSQLHTLLHQANSGRVLTEGLTIAIVGAPNVGKSSLLNALVRREAAIVTEQPGTTRDVLREQLVFAGVAITLADTAGLRHSDDVVEQEGMRRAHQALQSADMVWHVFDQRGPDPLVSQALANVTVPVLMIRNKIDLAEGSAPPGQADDGDAVIALSALTGEGVDLLAQRFSHTLGLGEASGGEFSARQRHIEALQAATSHLEQGADALRETASGELLAEHLRYAADALATLTGEISADELLGHIFSQFCIGK